MTTAFGLDPESLAMLFGISLFPLCAASIGIALSLPFVRGASYREAPPMIMRLSRASLLAVGPAAGLPFLVLLLECGGSSMRRGWPVVLGVTVVLALAGPVQAELARVGWERRSEGR